MIQNEIDAARESISSGLYVILARLPTCILTSTAADEIRNGTGQCCRVVSVADLVVIINLQLA